MCLVGIINNGFMVQMFKCDELHVHFSILTFSLFTLKACFLFTVQIWEGGIILLCSCTSIKYASQNGHKYCEVEKVFHFLLLSFRYCHQLDRLAKESLHDCVMLARFKIRWVWTLLLYHCNYVSSLRLVMYEIIRTLCELLLTTKLCWTI